MEEKIDRLIEQLVQMNDYLSELIGAVESVAEAIEEKEIIIERGEE